MTAPTNFVVLTQPRSGSNWLMDTLNRLEGVTAHDELLVDEPRQRTGLFPSHPLYADLPPTRRGHRPSVIGYIHRLYGAPGTVGFKLMTAQLRRHWTLVPYFVARRASVVHLVRRDVLGAVVSDAVARSTQRWHVLAGEANQDAVRVELDPNEVVQRCVARLRAFESTRRYLRLLPLRHHEVAYEDLLGDRRAFDDVCRFLHLDPPTEPPESGLVRSRTRPAAEAIANFDEVHAALAASPLASVLDASPAPAGPSPS